MYKTGDQKCETTSNFWLKVPYCASRLRYVMGSAMETVWTMSFQASESYTLTLDNGAHPAYIAIIMDSHTILSLRTLGFKSIMYITSFGLPKPIECSTSSHEHANFINRMPLFLWFLLLTIMWAEWWSKEEVELGRFIGRLSWHVWRLFIGLTYVAFKKHFIPHLLLNYIL